MAITAGINSNGNITPEEGGTVASQFVSLIYIAGLLARGELTAIQTGDTGAGDIDHVTYDPDTGVLEWTGVNSGSVTIDAAARPAMKAAYETTSIGCDERLDQILSLCTARFGPYSLEDIASGINNAGSLLSEQMENSVTTLTNGLNSEASLLNESIENGMNALTTQVLNLPSHNFIMATSDAKHLEMVELVNSRAGEITDAIDTAAEECLTDVNSEGVRKLMWLVNLVLAKRIDTLAQLSLNSKGSKLYVQDIGAIDPQSLPDDDLIDSATTL